MCPTALALVKSQPDIEANVHRGGNLAELLSTTALLYRREHETAELNSVHSRSDSA